MQGVGSSNLLAPTNRIKDLGPVNPGPFSLGVASTPLTTGDKALFCVDVREHACHIDYRNLRPKFVETFLDKLVNWKFAEANFA